MGLLDPLVSLRCAHCNSKAVLGLELLTERLRNLGMLRRESKPDWEFLIALLDEGARKLICDDCHRPGQIVEVLENEDDADWGEGKKCEGCGAAIPPERLEIFPDTEYCPDCQAKAETGEVPGAELEYCQYCGDIMETARAGGSGIARYVMRCRGCRR